jgi:HD-GYP domain-containing protein (c-di-GMP phosphodiesterase class II)/DNA-binding CsgD family transcriptional regulator
MVATSGSEPVIRRAEIVAALSVATDLAMGRPVEFALRASVIAVRLGEALTVDAETLAEVYWQSLLRYIGCNADTHVLAALFGDEMEFRRAFDLVDLGSQAELMRLVIRSVAQAHADERGLGKILAILQGVGAARDKSATTIEGHCDVAARLAVRLGFGPGPVANLRQIYERWDGGGLPAGLKGEEIAPAVRIVTLAQDLVALTDAHGEAVALAIVGKRRGTIYDPAMVDRLLRERTAILGDVDAQSRWDKVLALEPLPFAWLDRAGLDEACLAMADFIDVKSPFTLGHSRRVAEIAEGAARDAGLPEDDRIALRRVGLLHDLGNAGVATRVWVKEGPLNDREREQVRLHAYWGERVLARPALLASRGELVGRHHERLDGSGYHRGLKGSAQSPSVRIIAATEAYVSMREPRAHRPALSESETTRDLKKAVREGALDGNAVEAVLAVAGLGRGQGRRTLTADLTAREVEVLRFLAAGRSMKEIGRHLGISPKTVDNHIQNIYGKIAVKTRAGATLFAIEHGILENRDS